MKQRRIINAGEQAAPPSILNCLGGYVDYYSRTKGSSTAIVFETSIISYNQLAKNIEDCTKALIAMGLEKGDRVAMLCTPRPEFWIVFLAATRIGLTWVGLNPGYKLDELRHIVGDCQPKILFSIVQFKGRQFTQELSMLCAEFQSIDKLVTIDGEISGAMSLDMFLSHANEITSSQYLSACQSVNSREGTLLVYTSGTTGKPKGAILSNYGLVMGATMQASHFAVTDPKVVVAFPINHVACIADSCATTLIKGGKIIFHECFDPKATLQSIQDEKCSLLLCVPTMLQMMLNQNEFGIYNLSSLECIAWGGAAMPSDDIAKLKLINARLLSIYGLTEASADIVFCTEELGQDALAKSIGLPDKSVECRIVDNSGNHCSSEVAGELQFKADFFFIGYWNQPQASKDAFTTDGWLKSGDIGFWRKDGNIELVGRLSEMFKSGGYNVYPREIEVVLESLPEVAMAAVVSIKDDVYQEVGHAFIILEPGHEITADKLREFCKINLANYKVPKQFVIRQNLPMLPVGKIDKNALRREALVTN